MDRARRATLAMLLAAATAGLSGCKVVPIAPEGTIDPERFDAASYAQGLWAEKALPHFSASAKPLPEVLPAIAADFGAAGEQFGHRAAAEGSPWSFIVSGRGTVLEKNTTSRAGSLRVAIEGIEPPAEVSIQIGPVVRGNALRDSLPFVSFKDFTNQLEFADVGKAITGLAMAGVAADAEAIAVGQVVEFTGAMSLNSKADKIVVTPITLRVAP